MGEYVYRTIPSLIQPTATVKLDTGEIIHTPVAGYTFAYKPYAGDERENRKMATRTVTPARRTFAKMGVGVPLYGAAIGDKAAGPAIGDRVFRTRRAVSMSDYYFDRIGVIINLDGSECDRRGLGQILDPAHYGIHNAHVARYIGKVIMHDYGYGTPLDLGEDHTPAIEAWKAKLDPAHLALFEELEATWQQQ